MPCGPVCAIAVCVLSWPTDAGVMDRLYQLTDQPYGLGLGVAVRE